jgi:hypothetical protein
MDGVRHIDGPDAEVRRVAAAARVWFEVGNRRGCGSERKRLDRALEDPDYFCRRGRDRYLDRRWY